MGRERVRWARQRVAHFHLHSSGGWKGGGGDGRPGNLKDGYRASRRAPTRCNRVRNPRHPPRRSAGASSAHAKGVWSGGRTLQGSRPALPFPFPRIGGGWRGPSIAPSDREWPPALLLPARWTENLDDVVSKGRGPPAGWGGGGEMIPSAPRLGPLARAVRGSLGTLGAPPVYVPETRPLPATVRSSDQRVVVGERVWPVLWV